MRKFVFVMLFCVAAVCGVHAQGNPMKFNGFVAEYNGDNAQTKKAAEALKAVMPDVVKAFGWEIGREYILIDQNNGMVSFMSGENATKETSGNVYAFDPGTEYMSLSVTMDISDSNYDFDVNVFVLKDTVGANLMFDSNQVVEVVSNVLPDAVNNAALMKVYNTVMQYPEITIGMSVLVDLPSMQ